MDLNKLITSSTNNMKFYNSLDDNIKKIFIKKFIISIINLILVLYSIIILSLKNELNMDSDNLSVIGIFFGVNMLMFLIGFYEIWELIYCNNNKCPMCTSYISIFNGVIAYMAAIWILIFGFIRIHEHGTSHFLIPTYIIISICIMLIIIAIIYLFILLFTISILGYLELKDIIKKTQQRIDERIAEKDREKIIEEDII